MDDPHEGAREGLAHCLWELGERQAALEHYQDMLRLNPNDNQGIRYVLLACLMELGQLDQAEKLVADFKDEGTAAWLFTRALLFFLRQGDSQKARKALKAMEGVLVQPMIFGGVELMVGATVDTLFGPLIAFGLGGIHVEILGDVRFRVTPLTDRDAAEIVREIRGYRLLEGYRGHPPADVPAIEEALLRVSRLVEEVPEISELDLNPVFALPPGSGCSIVDARIRVDAESKEGSARPIEVAGA
jgi:hypothetical protein